VEEPAEVWLKLREAASPEAGARPGKRAEDNGGASRGVAHP